jgi:oligoendopeptidase F
MVATLPARADVPLEHTWDLASLYADQRAWDAEAQQLTALLPTLTAFQGRLRDAATLLDWIATYDDALIRMWRLVSYAMMQFDVDTTDQAAAGLRDQAIGIATRFSAATAFAEPEILALDANQLAEMIQQVPELAIYAQYLQNLQRRKAHIRSGEVEQLLAQLNAPLSTAQTAYQMLADGDLRFADAVDSTGTPHPVERGVAWEHLSQTDRTLRKSSWNAIADGFLAFKNTFGAIYAGSVRGNIFRAQARGYPSVLAAMLDEPNIPTTVYDQVIAACRRHQPIWHRYWDVRRRALGLEQMEPCDVFAPLVETPTLAYADAVALICAGLAPLGEAYVNVSRAGLTSERWVDIYPNKGKTSGAYSGGAYRTKPFILVNYVDSLLSMSTLAHELGHSMHTWLTHRNQPPVYSNYSIFVAEVASNFNQALVRGHLLQQDHPREFKIALIEEAMSNFQRYFFLMPILSQFEHTVHGWAAAGEPLTADRMNDLLADLFTEAYGPAVQIDRERNGIIWAQFPHLYMPYYVFQYASGIAAANAIAAEVLRGTPDAASNYLEFLATGSARYPLDALARVGIDLTTPEPMDRAFGVLEGFVDQLEALVEGTHP